MLGVNSSGADQTVFLDLKDFVQKETIARGFIRIVGNIIIAGPGPGVATGRDTEQLIPNVINTPAPSLGILHLNNVNGRDFQDMGSFDKGFSFRAPSIADAAGPTPGYFLLPLKLN